MLALQAALPRPAAAPPENGATGASRPLLQRTSPISTPGRFPRVATCSIGSAFHDKRGARERFERVLDWYQTELGLEAAAIGRFRPLPLAAARWSAPLPRRGQRVCLPVRRPAWSVPSSGEGISFALISGAAAGPRRAAPPSSSGSLREGLCPSRPEDHDQDGEGPGHLRSRGPEVGAAATVVSVATGARVTTPLSAEGS